MVQRLTSTAIGKIILTGEHAAVYGYPAIALPVRQVGVSVSISPNQPGAGVWLDAPQIRLAGAVQSLPPDNPLRTAVRIITTRYALPECPDIKIRITSTIPVAAGMGSSAAIAVALARAFAAYYSIHVGVDEISATAYEIEKIQHGSPSGIDNSVISYESAVYFRKGFPIEFIKPGGEFHFLIANSGVSASTRAVVQSVRDEYEKSPAFFRSLFEQIGRLSQVARSAFESGNVRELGETMSACHDRLKDLTVSSPVLDRLVKSALESKALGAKLSGAGRGGAIIALVSQNDLDTTAIALKAAGAREVLKMQLSPEVG